MHFWALLLGQERRRGGTIGVGPSKRGRANEAEQTWPRDSATVEAEAEAEAEAEQLAERARRETMEWRRRA